jgi:hypothetical protein
MAKKYIDTEKLKAEIERLYDGEAPKHDQQCDFDDGYFTGIGTISRFVDSLQKEQKPAEWSEEDEKKIHFLSRLIELQVKNTEYCFSKGYFVSKQEAIEMLKSLRPHLKQEQPDVDLEKTVEFECIGKKVKMTVQELINYYIDSKCVDTVDECRF